MLCIFTTYFNHCTILLLKTVNDKMTVLPPLETHFEQDFNSIIILAYPPRFKSFIIESKLLYSEHSPPLNCCLWTLEHQKLELRPFANISSFTNFLFRALSSNLHILKLKLKLIPGERNLFLRHSIGFKRRWGKGGEPMEQWKWTISVALIMWIIT